MSEWYSLKPLLSRGADINFVIGERSAGKTYAGKEWSIKDWINSGAEWAYVRLTKEEINKVKVQLFDDILPSYGYEVKTKGYQCFIRPIFEEEEYEDEKGKIRKTQPEPWKPFGYFLAVSEQQNFKSVTFPKVNKIILDEFIIENTRRPYPPDVVNQFLSLVLTIARKRKIRVVALSNAGYISNPFFAYYGVSSKDFKNSSFVKRNDGHVIFEYYEPKNSDLASKGIIANIASENYKDYALRNKFKDSSEDMVAAKPGGARPLIKLTDDGQRFFVVWKSKYESNYWVTRKDSPAKAYSVKKSFVSSEAPYSDSMVKVFQEAIDRRGICFDSADTRAVFLDVLGRN